MSVLYLFSTFIQNKKFDIMYTLKMEGHLILTLLHLLLDNLHRDNDNTNSSSSCGSITSTTDVHAEERDGMVSYTNGTNTTQWWKQERERAYSIET